MSRSVEDTQNTLESIRERWSKVTQGTWSMVRGPMGNIPQPKPDAEGRTWGVCCGAAATVFAQTDHGNLAVAPNCYSTDDARAIVNAPADIAYLLERVEALETALESYKAQVRMNTPPADPVGALLSRQIELLTAIDDRGSEATLDSVARAVHAPVDSILRDVEYLEELGFVDLKEGRLRNVVPWKGGEKGAGGSK
jgi:hypothetical protein